MKTLSSGHWDSEPGAVLLKHLPRVVYREPFPGVLSTDRAEIMLWGESWEQMFHGELAPQAFRVRLGTPHLLQLSVHLLLLQLASFGSPLGLFCQELQLLFFLLHVF